MSQTKGVDEEPTDALLAEYFRSRDLRVRDELVNKWRRLVYHIVNPYADRNPNERDDLEQEGMIALVHALDRFDPSRGIMFKTFASVTIVGIIRHYFRDNGFIKVPRDVRQKLRIINKAQESFEYQYGRQPTTSELAHATGFEESDVADVLRESGCCTPRSLDSLVVGNHSREVGPLHEVIGQPDPAVTSAVERIALCDLLGDINKRNRSILLLFYEEQFSQEEIAARVGLSQMQVSRILRSTLETLRRRSASQ